jgi:hypothetical protein
VPFLARYTSRKRSLSLEQFLEMLRKVQCCGAVRAWEAKDSFMMWDLPYLAINMFNWFCWWKFMDLNLEFLGIAF